MQSHRNPDEFIELNSGVLMPLIGYGTYQVPANKEGETAILTAIDSGYKLLDCASFYRNEDVVGRAISKRDRSSLYIVSKVWNDAIYDGSEAVRASCLQSIRDLYVYSTSLFSNDVIGNVSI